MSITFTPEEIRKGSKSSSFPLIHSVAPKAPCAAVAIVNITKASEEDVIRLLDKYQSDWRRTGTYVHTAMRVFRDLGFKYERISIGKQSRKKIDRMTFSEVEFCLRYRTGTYYVCTFRHAYVIHNQYVIDCIGKTNQRRVDTALRIEKDEECLSMAKAG